MNSEKQDENYHSEIPMVAAIPMVHAEHEDCIHVYQCSIVQSNSGDDANNGVAPSATSSSHHQSTTATVQSSALTTSTATATSTAQSHQNIEATLDETEVAECNEQATADGSDCATADEATQQAQRCHEEEEPQSTPCQASSPSISAIATPEPYRQRRHQSEPPARTPLGSNPQEEATCTSSSSPSITAFATPEPIPRQQQPQQREVEMAQLNLSSPAPSMVVTDERHEPPPISSFLGKWRTSLFSCFSCELWCTTSLPWMACCCDSIVVAQLMTRLRLNWWGRPDHDGFVRTFGIVVAISFSFFILLALGLGAFLVPFFVIWVIVLGTRVRAILRHRYQIPAQYCNCCPKSFQGLLEDCCCMLWCPCCSLIQMAQQTHDEKQYPYECFSPTGLPTYAPGVENV